MKKKLAILLVGTMIASSILAGCGSKKSEPTKKETSGELKGDITFWHSFTQGPRMEVIQQTADQFMKDNPGVKIKIETFSWGDFYTKWTTGLASGNVPDMSTALPGHVVEMMDADALEPVDDLIDDIGRNKFSKTALSEGKKDGTCYSLPLYSHAQVIWYRKDLLQKAGLSVPKTWDEFAEAAKTLTKDGVYGCSFPCGSNDLMVNTEQGAIFYSAPLIPNYTGMQFKKLLEDKFKIPCEVENDVNCAGLAEYRSGAAKGSHVALILTIGTGIGGSIIMDGEVYHGFSNSACEVGYMHMNDSDFQTLGAASILTKKVSEWKGETEKKWDGYHIFEEAKKGDKLCLLAIDEMVDILGEGIANICYVINPEVVVLGGGIMAQEQFLKERVECAVKRYLVSSIEEHTKIVFAKHQNDAGMLGAFYHFCSLH